MCEQGKSFLRVKIQVLGVKGAKLTICSSLVAGRKARQGKARQGKARQGQGQAECVLLWSVSNVARQHGLVVAGMCQRCTNPFLKTRFVYARIGQGSPSLSKPVRRIQLMWVIRLQNLLLEL
jgi:hypothetical protein